MLQSVKIMQQCLEKMLDGLVVIEVGKVVFLRCVEMKSLMEVLIYYFKLYIEGYCVLEGEVYVVVEVLKGEFGVYLVFDGFNKLYCCKIRVFGFFYFQVMDFLCKGYMLVDVLVVLGLLDIVFGEVD